MSIIRPLPVRKPGWRPTFIPGCKLWLKSDSGINQSVANPLDISGCVFWVKSDSGVDWSKTYNSIPWTRYDLASTFQSYFPPGTVYDWSVCSDIGDESANFTIGDTVTLNSTLGPTVATGIIKGVVHFVAWGGDWMLLAIEGTIPGTVPIAGAANETYSKPIKNGELVGGWADRSGNGYDLVQNTDANKLLWATNQINGYPSLTSDGLTDYMKSAGFTLNQPYEVYAVVKQIAWSGGNETWIDGLAGNDGRVYCDGSVGNPYRIYNGGYGGYGPARTVGVWEIVNARFDNASAKTQISVNGTRGVLSAEGLANPGGITLAAYGALDENYGNYSYAEVIIFDHILSDTDRERVEAYLAMKYGISVPVSSWADQSGNGNDVAQADATKQPIWISNQLNTYPVLRFNNGSLSRSVFTLSQPFTLFFVDKTARGTECVITSTDTYIWHTSSQDRAYAGAYLDNDNSSTLYEIFSNIFNGGSSKRFLNGGVIASGGVGGSGFANLFLGVYPTGVLPLYGDIVEVIFFDSALSDGNRLAVESYLNRKYDIY